MSALAEGLCAVGWATTSVVGDEATVISAIASVGDQLGKRVHGRGSAEIELIVPTPHELAHPSRSAHTIVWGYFLCTWNSATECVHAAT